MTSNVLLVPLIRGAKFEKTNSLLSSVHLCLTHTGKNDFLLSNSLRLDAQDRSY